MREIVAVKWLSLSEQELTDANWNVVAVTNLTGAVQERYKYDAFGKRTATMNSSVDFDRGFTGQVYDKETGLMLYRNRYYSTELGRFVSRDPILYEAGDANIYRYVGNMPLLCQDFLGFSKGGKQNPRPCEIPSNWDQKQIEEYIKKNKRMPKKQLDAIKSWLKVVKRRVKIKNTNIKGLFWWTPPAILLDGLDQIFGDPTPIEEIEWIVPGIENPLYKPFPGYGPMA